MIRQFLTAALVSTAMFASSATVNAQHHYHGHGHHGHGHHGHHHSHGHFHFGGLGFGYWPSFYYPTWSYGWPYYGSYYPSTYYYGGWPYYLGSGVSFSVARTIVTVPNTVTVANTVNVPNTRVAARPADIQFGGFVKIGELSARLIQLANELCLDLHHNYQHNNGFADTYRAAYQIFDTAKFVNANPGNREEISRRVNELDGLFHQVQSDVRRFRRRSVRQIAGTGLQTKLNEVETTLHDLMADVGVMGTHGAPPPAAAPANAEVAPPPPPPLPAPNPPRGN
jgi:hypothetical protein